jgi:hypothetical protein
VPGKHRDMFCPRWPRKQSGQHRSIAKVPVRGKADKGDENGLVRANTGANHIMPDHWAMCAFCKGD